MGFFDFLNPPAANVAPPQINSYQPTGFGQAESGALGGIGNLGSYNMYGQTLPQAQGITSGLVNNPYAGQFMAGAFPASAMGQQGAQNQFGAGGTLYGAGNNLLGYGGAVANTAFDPQNALYGRTLQQLQDQTRAGEAARGIAMTPYGAGLENQALSNFNIDWQNNQLNRQVQGASTLGALTGAAGGAFGQASGLQGGAPGAFLSAAGLPYGTYQGIGTGQLGALGQLGQFGQQAATIPQQQIADWQNYLGWGTGAQGAANQAQLGQFNALLNQANQGFNQQQTMFGDIGKAISAAAPYAMAFLSDRRIKDDIVPIGGLYDGTPVYSFRYKGDPASRVGLMAQDVEKRRPDAVVEIGGIKAVDYGKATEFSRGLSALSSWG